MDSPHDLEHDKAAQNLRRSRRSWITVGVMLVTLVVSAVLLVRLKSDIDWALFRQIAPAYLVLILLLSALCTALYVAAVYVLVRAGGRRTTLAQTYLVLTSSLSVNYITPVKVGIPLRIYLYKQFMHIPLATGTALVALETWLGMLIPALIACVGIAVLFPEIGLLAPLTLLAVLLIGMGAMLFVKPSLLVPLLRRLPFQGFSLRLVRFSETVQEGFRCVSAWRLGGVALLLALNVAAATTRLYLVLLILGQTVSWPVLLAVFAISITAGNLSMIPMGLGVRDASLTLLLARLGVPDEVALSIAVIQRFFAPGWPLLLGLISANVLGISEMTTRLDT